VRVAARTAVVEEEGLGGLLGREVRTVHVGGRRGGHRADDREHGGDECEHGQADEAARARHGSPGA